MFNVGWPTIEYDSVGQGNTKTVTDLLRRVAMRAKVKANTLLYDYHDIVEGDTPESVAFEFYDDPKTKYRSATFLKRCAKVARYSAQTEWQLLMDGT